MKKIICKLILKKIDIKFPNDLLFEKKKICGILQELVYMNSMDTEFLNRIAQKEDIYNLCLAVDADFYHQFHGRDDGASNDTTQPHAQQEGMRKTNPVSVRNEMIINPNPDNWGLLDEPIETLSI